MPGDLSKQSVQGHGRTLAAKKAVGVRLTEDPRFQIGERRVDSAVLALDLITAIARIIDLLVKGIGKHQHVGASALAAGKARPRSKAYFLERCGRVWDLIVEDQGSRAHAVSAQVAEAEAA